MQFARGVTLKQDAASDLAQVPECGLGQPALGYGQLAHSGRGRACHPRHNRSCPTR